MSYSTLTDLKEFIVILHNHHPECIRTTPQPESLIETCKLMHRDMNRLITYTTHKYAYNEEIYPVTYLSLSTNNVLATVTLPRGYRFHLIQFKDSSAVQHTVPFESIWLELLDCIDVEGDRTRGLFNVLTTLGTPLTTALNLEDYVYNHSMVHRESGHVGRIMLVNPNSKLSIEGMSVRGCCRDLWICLFYPDDPKYYMVNRSNTISQLRKDDSWNNSIRDQIEKYIMNVDVKAS